VQRSAPGFALVPAAHLAELDAAMNLLQPLYVEPTDDGFIEANLA
jgi:hypothetical protein